MADTHESEAVQVFMTMSSGMKEGLEDFAVAGANGAAQTVDFWALPWIGGDSPDAPPTTSRRYIPTDIILNILIRLPASSLYSMRYVSNEWYHIISDPDFAEAHYAYQSSLISGNSIILCLTKDTIFSAEASPCNPISPQRVNLPGARGNICVHGSCKGLILFQCSSRVLKRNTLHVANPITGDSVRLPPFYKYNGSILSASIDCVQDRDIKVVVVARRGKKIPTTPLICGILTLGSRTWRELHIPISGHLLEPYKEPTHAGGALNWIYDTGILSLNLLQEKFLLTNVTFCSYKQLKYDSDYIEWDGYFAIFTQPKIINQLKRLWVLRDSGWTKLPYKDVLFEHLGYTSGKDGSSDVVPPRLCDTTRKGTIIFFSQKVEHNLHLLAYDLGCREMMDFTQLDKNFVYRYNMVHTSSLITCSSYGFPERIGTCREGGISFSSLFTVPLKILACFKCQ